MRQIVLSLCLLGCFFAPRLDETAACEAAAGQTSAGGVSMDSGGESQLAKWVEMLDSPHFRDRAEATRKLTLSGKKAIDVLERVVLKGGLEASSRAIGILGSHFRSDDVHLKEAATGALQHIAASHENPHWRTANQLLNPAPKYDRFAAQALRLRMLQMAPRPLAPNPKPPANGPIPPANGGQRLRVEIKIRNGKRTVTIQQNGKMIRVADQGDKLEVEKSDGNGATTKSTYQDRTELKEKDPESHRLLEKHGWPAIKP